MAILDKQGLQHYANKMCNADNRKVGSKSLPTALNDIDTAINGFKTLFESEYGTPINMELTNNQNIFTVGTSTDIDKKDDVENSFTDVELNGNSLINLHNGNIGSNKKCTEDTIKPNTVYTLIANVIKTGYQFNFRYYKSDGTTIGDFALFNSNYTTLGVIKKVITSRNDCVAMGCYATTSVGDKYISDLMILEGDWTNKPIPQYFEGLKSVGEKENQNHKIKILSQNKNLFNYEEYYKYFPSTKTDDETILSHSGDLKGGNHNTLFLSPMKVALKPNTTYTFCVFNLNDSYQVLYCEGCLSTKQSELSLNIPIGQIGYRVFTTNSTNYKDGVSFKFNTSAGKKAKYKIMIVEGDIRPSNYIHHDSNKKEILLNEPLRGLPNGIKDTIEKINDEWKIVRRCGEVVLDGSENWSQATSHNTESTSRYRLTHNDLIASLVLKKDSIGLCNTIPCYPNAYWSSDIELIENDTIYISIRKKIVDSLDNFKSWLQANPTKVVYELTTPIVEDIDPVTLQCWKNGTISLIDEVIPAETTHTVALNKSAQIQKNIEELTVLRNRVKALEEQYDKTALNQAYEVELLRLDMQLDNII